MVFVTGRMSSIDSTLDPTQDENSQDQDAKSPGSYSISSSSSAGTLSPRRTSTSSIINPFDSSSPVKTASDVKPLSLAFLYKKRHNSDPLIEIPSPQSNVSSPLMSEPRLIRKKSGELVKSSLKLNQLNNSKSMPTTPMFKNVHFGQAVDVRYFSEEEKPSAVSAHNSPTLKGVGRRKNSNRWPNGAIFDFRKHGDDANDESEDDEDDLDDEEEEPPDWDLELLNFDKIRYSEKFTNKSSIFLETLSLNDTKESLIGLIAVKNLSFHKDIHLRYTFDDWKTIIEIECTFESETKNVPRILKRNNYDRFKFKLELKNFNFLINKDKPHSASTIGLKFCIRYRYDNLEIWDNNNFRNYEIELTHRPVQRHDKFTLNDTANYPEPQPESEAEIDDYFSYKKHDYDFSKPTSAFAYNPYDTNLSSPETPKILKGSNAFHQDQSEDEISLEPILRDLNTFTGSQSQPSQLDQYRKSSDASNKLTMLDDSNDNNLKYFNSMNNESPLVFGNKPTRTEALNPGPRSLVSNFDRLVENQSPLTSNADLASSAKTKLPQMNSKSYQELIDAYCFFKGPETDADIVRSDVNPHLQFVNTVFNATNNNNNNNNENEDVHSSQNNKVVGKPSTVSSYLDNKSK